MGCGIIGYTEYAYHDNNADVIYNVSMFITLFHDINYALNTFAIKLNILYKIVVIASLKRMESYPIKKRSLEGTKLKPSKV